MPKSYWIQFREYNHIVGGDYEVVEAENAGKAKYLLYERMSEYYNIGTFLDFLKDIRSCTVLNNGNIR